MVLGAREVPHRTGRPVVLAQRVVELDADPDAFFTFERPTKLDAASPPAGLDLAPRPDDNVRGVRRRAGQGLGLRVRHLRAGHLRRLPVRVLGALFPDPFAHRALALVVGLLVHAVPLHKIHVLEGSALRNGMRIHIGHVDEHAGCDGVEPEHLRIVIELGDIHTTIPQSQTLRLRRRAVVEVQSRFHFPDGLMQVKAQLQHLLVQV